MSAANTKQIQELRRRTGAGMLHCKSTLEATQGDLDQAVERLRLEGVTKAETRANRRTSEGLIASYIHHNGKLAALVEVNCETDFVARTDDFVDARAAARRAHRGRRADRRHAERHSRQRRSRRNGSNSRTRFGRPASPSHSSPRSSPEKWRPTSATVILVDQKWVREPKVTIADLINEVGAKTGENIQVRRFARFHMGIA